MHFDAPPHLAQELSTRLRDDPRVIRWTTLKLGDTLESVSRRPRSTRKPFEEDAGESWDFELGMENPSLGGFATGGGGSVDDKGVASLGGPAFGMKR